MCTSILQQMDEQLIHTTQIDPLQPFLPDCMIDVALAAAPVAGVIAYACRQRVRDEHGEPFSTILVNEPRGPVSTNGRKCE